jgi:hypothetical protein
MHPRFSCVLGQSAPGAAGDELPQRQRGVAAVRSAARMMLGGEIVSFRWGVKPAKSGKPLTFKCMNILLVSSLKVAAATFDMIGGWDDYCFIRRQNDL